MIERRYQMTRVRRGVYLLPSNDGQTLWKISSYEEDGSAAFMDPRTGKFTKTIRGTHWMTERHRVPFADIAPHLIGKTEDDWLYSDDWLMWSWVHKTRKEAIQAALEAGEREAAERGTVQS